MWRTMNHDENNQKSYRSKNCFPDYATESRKEMACTCNAYFNCFIREQQDFQIDENL